MMKAIRYISWAEFDWITEDILTQIRVRNMNTVDKTKLPKAVYGHPRGGLVLATVIAQHFNMRMWTSTAPGSIWVDDIFDSGKTWSEHQGQSLYPVCLLVRDTNTTCPGNAIFGGEAKDGEWIVFPWENKDREKVNRDLQKYVEKHSEPEHLHD